MHLLQLVLFRRSILQWLIPLVTLWVLIVCGLAFSGTVEAKAQEIPALEVSHDRFTVSVLPTNSIQEVVDEAPGNAPESIQTSAVAFQAPPTSGIVALDRDTTLLARDVLPAIAPSGSIQGRLQFEGECQTPMSLMLHSSFGSARMEQLAREILVRGFKTTTYRQITAGLRRGECPAANAIVVSLDDFGTDWLRPYFQRMIRTFTERSLQLVVAINVHGSQDPNAWAYLREIEALGNEVANHTIDHLNLARLEPRQVSWQVKGAHQIICHNLGRCPETLILPFGINDLNGYVEEAAAGYSYIVGIPGGRAFGGEPPYYLGRIAPDIYDPQATINELTSTFRGQHSAATEFLSLRANTGSRCAAGSSPSDTVPIALCATSVSTMDTSEVKHPDTPPFHLAP